MKNTFGTCVCVTIFGESHGSCIGAVIDGLSPGVKLDFDLINARMNARRAKGEVSTKRHEDDKIDFVSGVKNGFTTGTPLTMLIENKNVRSGDYSKTEFLARPGHADFSAQCKYHGFQDGRGGGHFSGRVTAALTAAGAVCECALINKNILIATHIANCAGVTDRVFSDYEAEIKSLVRKVFPVLDDEAGERMKAKIIKAKDNLDSVGGVLETAVIGMPAGVGEPWFDTLEGIISHAVFSVPGIKGIEFGAGFAVAGLFGSENNDEPVNKDGIVTHLTNNAGGINGGISNGMPVVFRCAVKPTPSIAKRQNTVNILTGENDIIEIQGRHDPAIIHRAAPVVTAVTAIAVCDMLSQRYGTDYFSVGGVGL
ncbi:MAG: chorismate synthase [Clostridiales bacterium]|nr:chorismate synthase [Clostridiales bacterium]